jgi:branched-chain amino acid transport system ATP-binding protein
MLEISGLRSGYERIEVLHDINLQVQKSEVVAIIGANGAGKTTLLRAISGVQPITSGRIVFEGKPIDKAKPSERVKRGIAHSPEGRQIFTPLTVANNLRLGAYLRTDDAIEEDIKAFYASFPVLGEKRDQLAGTLSGGQQQMLALARALMGRPSLLLLDEPSLGLSPLMTNQIYKEIAALRTRGMTMLLVEQNVHLALSIADRAYMLETGRVERSGVSSVMLADPTIQEGYLGK